MWWQQLAECVDSNLYSVVLYVPGYQGHWTGPVVGPCQHGEVPSVCVKTSDLSDCQYVSAVLIVTNAIYTYVSVMVLAFEKELNPKFSLKMCVPCILHIFTTYNQQMHSILIPVPCIFFILHNDQQMHKYFTNYYTPPTCFDTIVSSPGSP